MISDFNFSCLFVHFSLIEVLAAAPGDEDAIRCKIVALIKDDSVDEALASIQDSSKKTSIDFTFFKVIIITFFFFLFGAFVGGGDSSSVYFTSRYSING